MARPNLFLVGAPKCGTTSMGRYLARHPSVFMCKPKEPHYFAEDLPNVRQVETEKAYLDLFRAAGSAVVRGEASSLYLYSEVAIRRIAEFDGKARILAMLRNPVDLAYSWHSQLRFNLLESEEDFRAAWASGVGRRRGALQRYDEVPRLGTQVARLLDEFPRDQVHFVLQEDLQEDPREAYEGVLRFLGLASDGRTDFPRANRNKSLRSPRASSLLRARSPALDALLGGVKKVLGVKELGLAKRLDRVNTKTRSRPPMDLETRRDLSAFYRPEVELLSVLLDRDLGHWMAGPGAP